MKSIAIVNVLNVHYRQALNLSRTLAYLLLNLATAVSRGEIALLQRKLHLETVARFSHDSHCPCEITSLAVLDISEVIFCGPQLFVLSVRAALRGHHIALNSADRVKG